jgi:hypothetical protein
MQYVQTPTLGSGIVGIFKYSGSPSDYVVGYFNTFLSSWVALGTDPEEYTFRYSTTWLHANAQGVTKMPKKVLISYKGTGPSTVSMSIKYDFNDDNEQTFSLTPAAGTGYKTASVSLGGSGEVFMYSFDYLVNSDSSQSFYFNRLSFQNKLGRINSGI